MGGSPDGQSSFGGMESPILMFRGTWPVRAGWSSCRSVRNDGRVGNTARMNRYTVILCDGSTIKAEHILMCRIADGGVLEVAMRNDRTVSYSPFSWSHFEEAKPKPKSRIVD